MNQRSWGATLSVSIFWMIQISALAVFFVPFTWAMVGLWAFAHWTRAIGLTLTLIHLISIPVTNTSVNPARSIGVAIFQGGWALEQLWLFIVAPLIGGVLAAGLHRLLYREESIRLAAESQQPGLAQERDI